MYRAYSGERSRLKNLPMHEEKLGYQGLSKWLLDAVSVDVGPFNSSQEAVLVPTAANITQDTSSSLNTTSIGKDRSNSPNTPTLRKLMNTHFGEHENKVT